jgi:transposase, IS30 family
MYHHIDQEERYHIFGLSKGGESVRDIAKSLGRHHSTVYRELKRNRGMKGYRPQQAHEKSCKRRKVASSSPRIDEAVYERVEECLGQEWSPEQISGRLKLEGVSISHERVYQHIEQDQKEGGELYKRLRRQKPYRRKRFGGRRYGKKALQKRPISERPAIIESRQRCGDLEGDTIVGKGHKGAIVSYVCRKSLRCFLSRTPDKTVASVGAATLQDLFGLAREERIHSITVDNGSEFDGFAETEGILEVPIYFARPYHSNDRATNENLNGLVRQYFPKGTDFTTLTQDQVKQVEFRLNNRPRKCLGYKTPLEVFDNHPRVALQT